MTPDSWTRFNTWAEQIVLGYWKRQQVAHRVTDCPVARNNPTKTCHLCLALALMREAWKDAHAKGA